MRTSIRTATAAAFVGFSAAASLPSPAQAAININVDQVGSDVVATGSGTLDLTGLSFVGVSFATAAIGGLDGYVGVGDEALVWVFSGITGPSSFGYTYGADASFSSGTTFALNAALDGSAWAIAPVGYVSGSDINGTATWVGQSIASLRLKPGTYVYTAPNDTITLDIEAIPGIPEPSSWSMMLLGFGLLGVAVRRTRRSSHCA